MLGAEIPIEVLHVETRGTMRITLEIIIIIILNIGLHIIMNSGQDIQMVCVAYMTTSMPSLSRLHVVERVGT